MSTPKNHHFVPQVYLNNFSFDEIGNLYALKIKSPFRSERVNSFNKSAICYEENMYKVKTDKILKDVREDDPLYIEKNVFFYEKKFLKEITEKFENKKDINIIDSEKLIETLLSFKHRSKVNKEQLSNPELLKNLLEQQIEKQKQRYFSNKLEFGEEKLNQFFDLLEKRIKEEMKNEDVVSDLFNQILLNSSEGKIENHNWIVKKMLKSKFLVYCTKKDKPFITSDNPGFMMHDNGKIENMLLTDAKAFAFPISPTRLFVISPEIQDDFQPLIKKVRYFDSSENFVELTNKATVINCFERVYSNDKNLLSELKQKYHIPFVDNLGNIKTRHNNA